MKGSTVKQLLYILFNSQATESSLLLWLVGTSTHVSESPADLGLLKGEKNADRCTDEFTSDASTASQRAKELCLGHISPWQNPYFYSRSESYKLFLDRPLWCTVDLSL